MAFWRDGWKILAVRLCRINSPPEQTHNIANSPHFPSPLTESRCRVPPQKSHSSSHSRDSNKDSYLCIGKHKPSAPQTKKIHKKTQRRQILDLVGHPTKSTKSQPTKVSALRLNFRQSFVDPALINGSNSFRDDVSSPNSNRYFRRYRSCHSASRFGPLIPAVLNGSGSGPATKPLMTTRDCYRLAPGQSG